MSIFRQRKPVSERNRKFEARQQFQSIQEIAQLYTEGLEKEATESTLSYLIDTVARDLCSSAIAQPLYKEHCQPVFSGFPVQWIDQNDNYNALHSTAVNVDLTRCFVYVNPWDNRRMRDSLLHLQDCSFLFKPEIHHAFFYPELSLCCVINGNHSINAGRYFRKGTIQASSMNLCDLFPHIETDGANWYHVHKKTICSAVSDFRFAALYYLAKRRWSIRNL